MRSTLLFCLCAVTLGMYLLGIMLQLKYTERGPDRQQSSVTQIKLSNHFVNVNNKRCCYVTAARCWTNSLHRQWIHYQNKTYDMNWK